MTPQTRLVALPLALAALALLLPAPAEAGRRRKNTVNHEQAGSQLYASPQSNPIVASPDGSLVFVASTTSNRVDAIDAVSRAWMGFAPVGIDPVGLAVKPDGTELWVANHVSDSVSVVDIVSGSSTFLTVVRTVQDVTPDGLTRFDEPTGIAFAEDGSKAYVTLSSRNDVAVVDTATYAVTARLHITAQDPRAVAVRGGKLFVAAFESGNQTEISWCEALSDDTRPDQCTLEASDIGTFAQSPNVPGESKNIVVDDDVPDRDLFVFDTATDTLLEAVPGMGTLLYGLTVSSTGEVYVSQTDARNAVNGRDSLSSSPSDVNGDGVVNLVDLQNRMFLNQITRVDCGGSCGSPTRIDLEPLPPTDPAPGDALATPYGIDITADDALLVVTAAGSSRVASLDAGTGAVLDRLDVGAIPRGVALVDDGDGTHTAWVLNTLDNSVTAVDVDGATGALAAGTTIAVGATDPTPEAVRLGRIAFNNADASSSGTFSCGSCHPDANVDQVLWRIGGECFLEGCVEGEDEARSTMPIRGLRDTLPLHWDGTLGDPFGGPNGAVGSGGSVSANCSPGDSSSCFRQLVDASLSGVMCDQDGGCAVGPSGLPGLLDATARDDMAAFLENVAYPPARSRRASDQVSSAAVSGFEDFFTDVGGAVGDPDTCADSDAGCHELPLGTATNSETLEGFEAPTMRGMTDRFLQFSVGPTNTEELLIGSNDGFTLNLLGFPIGTIDNAFGDWTPATGLEETFTFGVGFTLFDLVYGGNAPLIFLMFEEASTGHSGAVGRQVTLSAATTAGCPSCEVEDVLDQLELADERGVVNLRGRALRGSLKSQISYLENEDVYAVGNDKMTRTDLIALAQSDDLVATLTGHLRSGVTALAPQPLIAPEGANCGTGTGATGDPDLPTTTTFTLEAKHVAAGNPVFVDGAPVPSASLTVLSGTPSCSTPDGQQPVGDTRIQIDLGTSFASGTHLVQVKNGAGLLSNELPIVLP